MQKTRCTLQQDNPKETSKSGRHIVQPLTPTSMYNMAKRYREVGSNNSISNNNWISDFINILSQPTTEMQLKNYTSIVPESDKYFLVPYNFLNLHISPNIHYQSQNHV